MALPIQRVFSIGTHYVSFTNWKHSVPETRKQCRKHGGGAGSTEAVPEAMREKLVSRGEGLYASMKNAPS